MNSMWVQLTTTILQNELFQKNDKGQKNPLTSERTLRRTNNPSLNLTVLTLKENLHNTFKR